MQSILGAGGAIGNYLAKDLLAYTKDIRLVSRNPSKINPTDELMPADLTDTEAVRKAVEGSEIVYIVVGFPYFAKVWKNTWPKFVRDVIAACKEHKAKLVFFDNIYMYDRNHLNGMDEDTPINPSSKKGEVRAKLHQMITNEFRKGELQALTARSADFYGPGIGGNGLINELVCKPFAKGKKANWMRSVHHRHSATYVPDAAKATAILGNTEDAYNQVWHLPTAGNPPTGKQWIEMIAQEMNVKPKYMAAPAFALHLMGLFVPIMRELAEMSYQFDRDYVFDSSKFEKKFDFKPTSYQEGIKETVERDFKKF